MLKRLGQCIREYKIMSILAPISISLEVIMEIIIPLLMAKLIDNGIDGGDMQYIVKMGGILLVFAALSLVFGALAGRFSAVASCGFAKNLRHDMFHNVQKFSFSNIDKFSTASIVTRLTTDVTNVQNSFQMIIRQAIRSPIMFAFSFVAALRISKELSMIFIAVTPFLALGLYLVVRFAHPKFVRVFKTYDKLNSVVQENLHGIRVVKSFVREKNEKEKFNNISKDIYKDFSGAEKTVAFNMPLMQLSMYTCMIFISWFGARAIVASGNNAALGLSTGELMSLLMYSSQILMSLMGLSMIFVMITISKASAERISEILSEETDIKNVDNPKMTVKDGSIEFENVSFKYNKEASKDCLKNISFSVKSGETIGIIGATGSSKTTLIQLISRLYDVTEGTVRVGGEDVREIDLETLRNSVSVVLQKNVLFSGTIRENLLWGNENATDEEIYENCARACADEFINSFPEKYETYVEQGGTNLSGGQRQRLCIARALLKKPKVLILDDSTSAVDTKTDAKIRKALRELLPETTKLIIAQRIASVKDADKILILEDGEIKAFGCHDELMGENEMYTEIYEAQIKKENQQIHNTKEGGENDAEK